MVSVGWKYCIKLVCNVCIKLINNIYTDITAYILLMAQLMITVIF